MASIQAELAKIFVADQKPQFAARRFKKARNNFWRECGGMSHTVAFMLPRIDPPFMYDPNFRDPNIGRIFILLGATMLDGAGFAQAGKATTPGGFDFSIDADKLLERSEPIEWRLTDREALDSDLEHMMPLIDAWFEPLSDLEGALELIESGPDTARDPSLWRAVRSRHARGERDLAQANIDRYLSRMDLNPQHYRWCKQFTDHHGYAVPESTAFLYGASPRP